jgi:16S rRNA processing protein RimM
VSLNNYYKAGQITRLHGVKGELSVSLHEPELFSQYSFETVFINPGGGPVPFFVTSFSFNPGKNILLLQLDGIDDPGSASGFVHLDLFLSADSLPKTGEKQFFAHEVIGFIVTDLQAGELGPITEVMDLPMQQVFKIERNGREILIPAVEAILVKIDRPNKSILIDAPEGLIDLYLSETGEEEE